ncbi:MAG: hypothetical protein B0D96_05535 [Candidatus Sedimenticola endophacoides]|uniref:Uncharacterized protein n=1 Tax=Candidatus Sedimenticola endophacoides TaxID=2548426 RepID=A0A657Q3J9_9GAMM|nr:MAG: hypothetical protein B0D94_08195 [Candidatus Sedimenticola endophacoides]OQX35932.1 MAG: hypothetical protein B0D96_05535 [Candidatus Sedimenticola endophacoides]OQX38381.1 MAG: hypothetical protein B0D89_12780 [Candidatus Sedimenticola endophacoides]OQX42652.1 MAG: hypothetical protein B0D88_06280 [Candidatus Sedimenticola endophacoides]OQX45909.1 MAG: hypothetical protein B0D85_04815 [Candidatus Sedimenticola endophacoides]
MKGMGVFLAVLVAIASLVVYGVDRLGATRDAELVAFQQQIAEGADPSLLLPSTAAAPKARCETTLYTYGLSQAGEPFIKSHYDRLYAADLGQRVAFFEQGERAQYVSELVDGTPEQQRVGQMLSKVLKACQQTGRAAVPTGLSFVAAESQQKRLSAN